MRASARRRRWSRPSPKHRRAREQAEARLAEAGEAIEAAEVSRQAAAAARDAAESEGASARAALTALESEAKALIKAVEGSSGDRAINHLKAEPGYERALAAALGDDLDAALDGDSPRRWTGAETAASDPALPAGCEALARPCRGARRACAAASPRSASPTRMRA